MDLGMWTVLFTLLAPVFGVTLRGQLNDLHELDYSLTSFALLELGELQRQTQAISAYGGFEFYGLVPGKEYLLTLESNTLNLPFSYFVVPKDGENDEFEIHKVADERPLTALGQSVAHPITVTGYRRTELVVDRPNFSIFNFFSQPTVMLSLGALVLITYLPSWIQGLDPELLEEMKKNHPGGIGQSKDVQKK